MKKTTDFVVLPHNAMKIRDKFLVSNILGGWDFLDRAEWRDLNAFHVKPGTAFYDRLRDKGVVADDSNIRSLLDSFRAMNANLFQDTSLHIAVVTTKCNLVCSYCQARVVEPEDMSPEVALRVLKYLFDAQNPAITLEFQGGEPLMNWPVVKVLIESARKSNTAGKDLRIALVSNLLLLDNKMMKVLADNDVQICSSLDGPQAVHDANRKYAGGGGTYRQVMAKAMEYEKKYHRQVQFLPTITKYSLKYSKEIVDEYVRLNQSDICLRPVNNMGSACCQWGNLGYTPEEFCDFYARSMDYVLALNKRGVKIRERMARVIATKVLAKQDSSFVDLMNPCGAGRATMAYMPDGSCYPCDEARILGEDMFKLGNILKDNYEDLLKNENLIQLLHASSVNLWHYGSVFSPWMGYCPVVNYAIQKNVVPKVACSPAQKILQFQFQYVFEKILEGGRTLDILKSWLEGGRA